MSHHKFAKQIHERDNYTCVYCNLDGKLSYINYRMLTLDHLKPKAYEENNSIENLITACFICNQFKGHFYPEYAKTQKDVFNEIRKHIKTQLSFDFKKYISDVKKFI